jgi:tRNA(fMet)-specific endonuclease VapC
LILDTNGLSALADGDPRLEHLIQKTAQIALPVIVLGEYRYGIRESRNRARYERWLADVAANTRVLEVDAGTAEQYADVRHELKRRGCPIPGNDLWIAALARQYDLPLLSRDRHFDLVPGIERIAW